MGSPLDFISSDVFRKKLVKRNLVPYAKSPNKQQPPINFEYIQSDSEVIDSPDGLIDEPIFADKLYPLNQYGKEGGYEIVPDPNSLLNTKSNEGEYGYQDANIIDEAKPESKKWKSVNAYSSGSEDVVDGAQFVESLNLIVGNGNLRLYNNQPYPNFVPSTYNPVSILLSSTPQGSNGSISQDSFIVRLGAKTLRKEFQERIATEIRRNTLGRVNVFNVRSGTDVLSLVTGRVPLIEPNYTITVPANPLIAATDFALRLAGSIIPVSPIPGSYFDTSINPGQPTTIQQLSNAFRNSTVGSFFNRILGGDKTGSQLFLNNTGGGQKSRLFGNIDYNKYKPDYDRSFFDRLAGAIVGSTSNNSDFYVGSRSSDPSRVFSPGGELPVNSFGQEQQSPVYGAQELAQLYEGPGQDVKLGANGPIYSNGGGIEGGFTWVSPKYKGNAGKRVGIGGEVTNQDENFRPSSYNSTESTNREYREGSILDDTQRIIDSQPAGGRRLQHVGNAIDQVSKVFNDGYKELTKGSRVLTYVGAIGQEVGTEYCRVFAKDLPYLQYNNLQKTDGMTTEGRKFAWSVLDKTYNLNIYPNKQEGGKDSTNLIGSNNNSYAKKYMFSIENLAWRTSNTPGYTVSDLPVCERGPNGGRVMWFPPYGLTFSETVSANFKGTDFLGRPEPVYTYNNTNRTGSLSWKIVVDHPSVLNLIVNKVLKNETNRNRIDSIIDSFFAGCRKYDLYELAKKYYTINPNDLYELQQLITSKEMTKEQLTYAVKTIQTGVDAPSPGTNGQPASPPDAEGEPNSKESNKLNSEFKDLGFYFDNDIPSSGSQNYESTYNAYVARKDVYKTKDVKTTTPYPSDGAATNIFFTSIVENNFAKLKQMADYFVKFFTENEKNENAKITIKLVGSASAVAKIPYNDSLSERRIESVKTWLKSYNDKIKLAIDNKKLLIIPDPQGERAKNVTPKGEGVIKGPYDCTDGDAADNLTSNQKIYTVNAMACRRVSIGDISVSGLLPIQQQPQPSPPDPPKPSTQSTDVLVGTVQPVTTRETQIETKWVERDNITKRVLRGLLSECDYFEAIKEETPMVFDNLKDKLKFFHPTFHSMTPEGLNSRLTFLQQCMRPGDTIPTIKSVGETNELQYNNAVNTSFGAPPVLILRVGDFYHTKIIPDSLGITYDPLVFDMNSEGIGLQPMIANITLSFKFVGGSGLKESVDKVQNALTFNYYANTEIYDDRADVTDTSYKVLDKAFLAAIGAQPPGATVNQVQNNNGQTNNETIGKILTVNGGSSGETGTITYKEFMDKVVSESQTYFTTIVNKSKECVSQYNNAILQIWTSERNYIEGKIYGVTSPDTSIVGKPSNIEKKIDKVFKDLISDIDESKDKQDEYIKFMSDKQWNLNERVLRQIKTNFKNVLNSKRSSFQTSITQLTQDITTQQQNYIQSLTRCNVVLYDVKTTNVGTDGLQQSNGNIKIYDVSGTAEVYDKNETDTYSELFNDVDKIKTNINEFYDLVTTKQTFTYGNSNYDGVLIYGDNAESASYKDIENIVFNPYSDNKYFGVGNLSFRREYMLLSPDILDEKKYESFKNSMIGNIIKNNELLKSGGRTDIDFIFDSYWLNEAKPAFTEENTITKSFIDFMETNSLKNFIKYTPFPSKERVFDYEVSTSPTEYQNTLIKSLGATTNKSQDIKTWNNEEEGLVIISKVKLN